MVFPVRSATEVAVRHLLNASIATTEKIATRPIERLELFLWFKWNFHMEFIPESAIVNKTRYKKILGCLRDSIRRKRPELWRRKTWLLLHDNAPAHRSVLVQEELARQQVTVLPDPPYSPDLAPCDFLYLSIMKALIRGRRFHSVDEIKTATREAVRDLPVNVPAVLPAAIPTLADVHSGQLRLFWGRLWICLCAPCYAASCGTSRFLWVPALQASVPRLDDGSNRL